MNIAIYSRILKPEHQEYVSQLLHELHTANFKIFIHKSYLQQLKKQAIKTGNVATFMDSNDIQKNKIDLVLALGGDGTLLDTLQFIQDTEISVAGINMGRLGFLADIHKEEIKQLVLAIKNNTYTIEKRSLIAVDANKSLFGDVNYGLNEFTIHKTDSSSMIIVHVFLNGEFLNSYWCDGLIIATPTGSTAYSLSCGGPIVFPNSNSFIITPVAPHNLNARPIIIPDNTVLSFEVETRAKNFLCTIDSRHKIIDETYQIAVKKAPFTFNLFKMPENSYLKTLREKLNWGEDSRN